MSSPSDHPQLAAPPPTMPAQPEALVRAVHAAPVQIVLAITGGGSRAIGDLLSVPGGSRTLLEAVVPYSSAALVEFLRARPEQFCDARTARAMAMASFWRARRLAAADAADAPTAAAREVAIVGVGCTASLASDRPKRGAHRLHVAIQTDSVTQTDSLDLEKGARDRDAEERLAGRLVLNQIAAAAGLPLRIDLELRPGETLRTVRTVAPAAWRAVLLGEADKALASTDSSSDAANGTPSGGSSKEATGSAGATRVVFPGAFHPLHDGHRQIAGLAERWVGAPAEFEISIENVDKPPLDYTEIARRVAQFAPGQAVWLTRAATFLEKSRLFPGAVFLVGVDTIARIADPKYYGADPQKCEAAVQAIAARGCRFLVYGRREQGQFRTLDEMSLPDSLARLCSGVPADRFRNDLSSTALRQSGYSGE